MNEDKVMESNHATAVLNEYRPLNRSAFLEESRSVAVTPLRTPSRMRVVRNGFIVNISFSPDVVVRNCSLETYDDELKLLLADLEYKVFRVDLSTIPMVMGEMLGWLVRLVKHGRVEIFNLSPEVREVFRITRLDQKFKMLDDPC